MRRSLVVVTAALLTLAVAAPAFGAQGYARGKDVYVVVMQEPPAAAYEGGKSGLAATAPKAGKKLNRNSAAVRNYVTYLKAQHGKAMRAVGAAVKNKFYDYTYSLNGFAAVLTGRQAAKMSLRSDVWFVERDFLRPKATDNSPDFLGLTDGGGLWDELGGQDSAGEDIIIGVIDTGIWPEHPSFSDQADLADRPGESGKRLRVYDEPPASWHGICQSGERWSQDDCNNKLIGARYFLAGFGKNGLVVDEYKSARDADGHGSHTASTAGGNADVTASIFGRDFGIVSGIAPRARIAMYKGLWNDLGGFGSDLAAAIDAAVGDGVDVINYSIGGSSTSFLTSDAVSFLFAARAGVYVATSAGNSGPGASTLGNPAVVPWLTTVGASTQDRTFEATATLGHSAGSVTGASVTEGVGTSGLVDSEDVGLANGDDPDTSANEVELCFPGTLDPAKVTGKIVLCLRGVNARVDKGLAVLQAGGVGMILYNPDDAQAVVTDNHWVPAVHINFTDGTIVKDYIDDHPTNATAAISAGTAAPAQGSVMADFSSRGPNGGSGDLLKPDVTAPGVNILAGNTPTPFTGRPGQLFQSISGTSMSSPHVAGIGALLLDAHPTWTPDMIKSALMTTGRQNVVKEDFSTPADPFDFGAGHVVPNSATDPGLVYKVGFNDYRNFLRGQGLCRICFGSATDPATVPIDASNLNLASIAVADLVGSQQVTRTVTNIGPAGTFTVSVDEPAGFDAVVQPTNFTLSTGASASYTVTFTRTDAAFDEWSFGALTWSDGTHSVRSPIAVEASILAGPATVTPAPVPPATTVAASGTATWQVKVGYSGTLEALAYGAAADNALAGEVVSQDPDQDIETNTFTSGVKLYNFDLAASDQYWAGGTFESTTEAGSDLDVYLLFDTDNDNEFDWDGSLDHEELVAFSADGDSEETVEVRNPDAGHYRLIVHGWGTPDGASTYTLHRWQVGGAADTAGFNATVEGGDPATVAVGETYDVTLNWSGLTATGTQYRGIVNYDDGSDVIGSTVVILNR